MRSFACAKWRKDVRPESNRKDSHDFASNFAGGFADLTVV